jgi:hypothetical protein
MNKLPLVAVGVLLTSAAPAGPRFSWDTVPVYYHSCNFTGDYTDEALKVVTKFPMVTIEKGQQIYAVDGKTPAPGYAETKIVRQLQRVKAIDPNISTIFYYNSVLDWPFYQLHDKFHQRPDLWLPSGKGDGKPCRMGGDGSFPNHTNMLVPNFAKQAAQDFWASECINMTKTGFVDGCFSDRSNGRACGAGAEYDAGHLKFHQDLQKALGNGVLIANNDVTMVGVGAAMIEGFRADAGSIKALMQGASLGKLVQAHAG